MGTRAIQSRIVCNKETLEHLWRTHAVFHERLPLVIKSIFKLRKGQIEDTPERQMLAQVFAQGLLMQDAKNAYDLVLKAMNSSARNTTARNALNSYLEKDPQLVQAYQSSFDEFVKGWKPLQRLHEQLADLPNFLICKLITEAVAIIRGHSELVALWKANHQEWLSRKSAWEAVPEHQLYLSLREKFDAFEKSVGGKISKRRGRWHLYLEWLKNHPELAAWRGGKPIISELSTEAVEKIRRAKPWKTRSVEAAEFWKANPELAALDRLHGEYEREYVRRRKRKRHPDGFDHRPTFTLPHATKHPRWLVFSAPQTKPVGYNNLQLPSTTNDCGSLMLLLLTGPVTAGEYPVEFLELIFRADPRLSRFRSVLVTKTIRRGKHKGALHAKPGYEFYDTHLRRWRPAEISGVKLIFKNVKLHPNGSLKSATPYLVFTCNISDLELTERARNITWSETTDLTKSGKKRKKTNLPDGLVVCSVDIGLRHVGFATICRYDQGQIQVLRSRSIWLDDQHGGPVLDHISRHKKKIRKLRQQRGKPIKGEESHLELQSHITNMGQDRFKKAARRIINFAWNTDNHKDKSGNTLPRADIILIEKLEGLIPDAEKERGINRALAAWNRGQLINRLQELADDAGYIRTTYSNPPHRHIASLFAVWRIGTSVFGKSKSRHKTHRN
ncbi:MAG: hypothetical protein SFX18_15930 [Pirellulales bacterium]|nr:hypothetical protein [Pirellulales bacterium]